MKRSLLASTSIGIVIINLFSCASMPKGAVAVKPFDREKYLGRWYEIARMDFRFERNLSNVTATYSVNNNGTIKVDNRGFDTIKNEWKNAIGKAKLSGAGDEGRLKVSFFGPFYSAYNVIALDSDYKYALVAGKNLKYLWILSREKTIPDSIRNSYLKIAGDLGFNITELVWTDQSK